MPERQAELGHAAADPPQADHAERPAGEVAAPEAGEVPVPAARGVRGLREPAPPHHERPPIVYSATAIVGASGTVATPTPRAAAASTSMCE